jgi:hypothetical protein
MWLAPISRRAATSRAKSGRSWVVVLQAVRLVRAGQRSRPKAGEELECLRQPARHAYTPNRARCCGDEGHALKSQHAATGRSSPLRSWRAVSATGPSVFADAKAARRPGRRGLTASESRDLRGEVGRLPIPIRGKSSLRSRNHLHLARFCRTLVGDFSTGGSQRPSTRRTTSGNWQRRDSV